MGRGGVSQGRDDFGEGSPQTPPGPPRYEESTAEFGFVERLLPPTRIPEPPPHPKYPTPSGWSPPKGQRPLGGGALRFGEGGLFTPKPVINGAHLV